MKVTFIHCVCVARKRLFAYHWFQIDMQVITESDSNAKHGIIRLTRDNVSLWQRSSFYLRIKRIFRTILCVYDIVNDLMYFIHKSTGQWITNYIKRLSAKLQKALSCHLLGFQRTFTLRRWFFVGFFPIGSCIIEKNSHQQKINTSKLVYLQKAIWHICRVNLMQLLLTID